MQAFIGYQNPSKEGGGTCGCEDCPSWAETQKGQTCAGEESINYLKFIFLVNIFIIPHFYYFQVVIISRAKKCRSIFFFSFHIITMMLNEVFFVFLLIYSRAFIVFAFISITC